MPFWIACSDNIKVRCLFLDELDQVSCVAEILLRFHIRNNIPTKSQDFLYPNLVQICNSFSNLVLSQIDGWQVGNSRNLQVILDKVSQTNRRFLDIKLIIAGSYTDKVRSQLLHILKSRNNFIITHGWVWREHFK